MTLPAFFRSLTVLACASSFAACSGGEAPAFARKTFDSGATEPVRRAVLASTATCPDEAPTPSGPVDDFEDGNLDLPSEQGLSGTWFVKEAAGSSSSSGPGLAVDLDPDAADQHVLHASEGDSDGAQVGVFFASGTPNCSVDALAFDGIAFRIKLVGSARLQMVLPATEPSENGGNCTEGALCGDDFGIDLSGDGTWQELSVPFSSMTQEGWGVFAPCLVSEQMGIGFRFASNGTADELWLDDIRFVPRLDAPDCSGPRPVLTLGTLSDFADGSLALAASVGGSWSVTDGTLDFLSEAGHTVLHGIGDDYILRATFAPATEPRCGVDARAFDGIQIRARVPSGFVPGYRWEDPHGFGNCDTCLNGPFCSPWSKANGYLLGASSDFHTYRVPFEAGSDPGKLVAVSLELSGEAWVDDVRLYSQGTARDFGERCTEDADCVTLHCLRGDGAAPGGVCVAECRENQCGGWAGTCASPSSPDASPCYESCTTDDASEPGPLAAKCHGRSDLACSTDDRFGEGATCQPRCMQDTQCGSGLFCGAHGACTSTRPSGLEHGSACDLDGITDSCAFSCLAATHTCTKLCPIGCAKSECAACPLAAEQCLPLLLSRGTGDLGACATPCNCNADCQRGMVCMPFTLQIPLKTRGLCAAAQSAGPGIFDCPTGCAEGPVRACHGAGDCLGAAQCLDDESDYGPCRCAPLGGEAGEGGDGEGGGSGASDTGGVSGESGSSEGGRGGKGGDGATVTGGTGGEPDDAAPGATKRVVRTLEPTCSCSEPGRSASGWSPSMLALLSALAVIRRGRGSRASGRVPPRNARPQPQPAASGRYASSRYETKLAAPSTARTEL